MMLGIVLALLAGAQPGAAAQRTWTVGGAGEPWTAWTQTSAAVEFLEGGGRLRLLSFAADENIVRRLAWEAAGTPQDYVSSLSYGRVWDTNPLRDPAATLTMVDGDSSTSTGTRFKQSGAVYAGTSLFFDLGTRFPVSRFSFYPRQQGADEEGRPYEDDFVRAFELMVQDGQRYTDNDLPIYGTPPLRIVEATTSSIADIEFPLQFVRYVRLRVTSNTPFEIAEFEVYGRGFSPYGELLSKVIDLGEEANFDRLTWQAEGLRQGETGELAPVSGAAAGVTVQMRTGSTPDPLLYYQIVDQASGERTQVTAAEYARLEAHQRGGTEDDQTRWSVWSPPWTVPDVRIDLPSPRRYCQFRLRLESRAILDGAGVGGLSIGYAAPPLAGDLAAEVSLAGEPAPPGGMPVAPAGEYSDFVFDLRADVRRADVGLNALEIRTPARPQFLQMERGGPSWVDLQTAVPDSAVATDSSLVVFFAPVRSLEYFRVHFRSPVFSQATFFDAVAHYTLGTDPPQKVLPGDANPTVQTLPGSALRVLTAEGSARTLLAALTLRPRVVTPNGDGANDAVAVEYTLTQLLAPVPVTIGIYDLSGRCRRRQLERRSSGAHRWQWDGRDDAGQRLPPGIYVVGVKVETDARTTRRAGTVAVAY